MKLGGRVPALNKTLQNISFWATKLEEDGISLRFLNNVQDDVERFNGLTDAQQIDDLITEVPLRGPTQLGTMLRKKVIRPLEEKAMRSKTSGETVRPRIIAIITDGEVGSILTISCQGSE
jgi:hypothetical protein